MLDQSTKGCAQNQGNSGPIVVWLKNKSAPGPSVVNLGAKLPFVLWAMV